ncbi:MAG: hypothetical protein GC181_01555 [Bacteroidetes bacterium]|nr:hypothetical protein [Bacteroidota bacterium]
MRYLASRIIILIHFTAFFKVSAQIDTDRPGITNSPNTVPKGVVQFETGAFDWVHASVYDNQSGYFDRVYENDFNTTLIRYGFWSKTELRAQWGFHSISTRYHHKNIHGFFPGETDSIISIAGFKSLTLGFKRKLIGTDKWNSVIIVDAALPFTAGAEVKPTGILYETFIPVVYSLNKRISLCSQLTLTWMKDQNLVSGLTAKVALKINNKINAFFEPYGYRYTHNHSELWVDSGVTFLVRNSWQLDVYGGAGKDNGAFLGGGLSFMFNTLKKNLSSP